MSTVAAPSSISITPSRSIFSWRALLGVTVLVLGHAPIMWRYLRGMMGLPHYEFLALLPVGAAVLFWPRAKRLGDLQPGKAAGFAAWMTAAVLPLLFSVVLDSPWFGAISTLFAGMAVAYAVGGRRLVWAVLPAWALLWVGIRLPLMADERLAIKLQDIAARHASTLMNYMNQDHILDGNVVETKHKRYMVEEACSGLQSLFAITACTMFFGLWMREPPGRVALLMLVAWWWVWVQNVVRVIAVTVLNSKWGLPVESGVGHDILSMTLFSITLALIVSSEHLMLFFFPRGIFSGKEQIDNAVVKPLPDYGPTRLPVLANTWLASSILVVGYVMLILLQWLPQLNVPSPTATPTALEKLPAGLVPQSFAGWTLFPDVPDGTKTTLPDGTEADALDGFKAEQRRADSQWGAYSRTWQYGKGSKKLVLSIDYPFHGWHELTICYRADGWTLEGRTLVDVPREGQAAQIVAPGEKCVKSVLRRPEVGSYAYLLFTTFNDREQVLKAPENLSLYQRLRDRVLSFVDRVKTLGASGSGQDDLVQSFQLQAIMQGSVKPSEADEQEMLALFAEVRTRLGMFLKAQSTGGAQP